MKCVILAGGSGDRLWPLSRKQYPKQFMEVRRHRSLLQETVVRNMPYCDEFIIITNAGYEFIVEGQLQVFQGLNYRCVFEDLARGTAAAVGVMSMLENPSELLYVVAADIVIEGGAYRDNVLRAMELARMGNLAVFGIMPRSADSRFGYIRRDGEQVLEYREKPTEEEARGYVNAGGYLWNSGMFVVCAGDFVQELKRYQGELYESCRKVAAQARKSEGAIHLQGEAWQSIVPMSVEKAVFEHTLHMRVVEAAFDWVDVDDLEDVIPYISDRNSRNVILDGCDDVDVVNRTRRQLVVGEGLSDLLVVNTEDALYVAPKGRNLGNIKELMQSHQEQYGPYFERNRVAYRHWGQYEVLSRDNGFKVKKVTIYPGQTIYMHSHEMRSEHWSIVSGRASITLAGRREEYGTNESIYVPKGVLHEVSNVTEEPLIIIEVGIGETITESDMVRDALPVKQGRALVPESISRLEPTFKDYLWGGTRLRDIYHKKCDYDVVAESWELSAHPAGQSILAEGRYKGMRFGSYVRRMNREYLGWKCQAYEEFPILVKFIDAKDKLSIQVHPEDAYALAKEGEYGKNEMWYIMDCEEGAALYCGFQREVTKDEVLGAVESRTLPQLLNRVEVHKGDTIFIPAGTVHAIGAGIMVCEIQQNSNSTYRLYDYGRRDKYGNERELHLTQALEVLDVTSVAQVVSGNADLEQCNGYSKRLLGQCKYFECMLIVVEREALLTVDEASFLAVVVLVGQGTIAVEDKELLYMPGDTFFIPAGKRRLRMCGQSQMILIRI